MMKLLLHDDLSSHLFLTASSVLIFLSISGTAVEAYKNYTVGGSLGWFQKPGINYQKWADSNSPFSLGDFLIFNTDNNHSVIQTYNSTTYNLCDYDDSADNDTVQWSAAEPSTGNPRPVTVPVPLTRVGPAYFFSGDYDGDQCRSGLRFQINVTYGQGLPPELRSPFDDFSPGPAASAVAGGDDAAPDTLVPSNFDHPKDVSDDGGDGRAAGSAYRFEFLREIPLLMGFLVYCFIF